MLLILYGARYNFFFTSPLYLLLLHDHTSLPVVVSRVCTNDYNVENWYIVAVNLN